MFNSLKRTNSFEYFIRQPDYTVFALHVFDSPKRTKSLDSVIRESDCSGCIVFFASLKITNLDYSVARLIVKISQSWF